MHKTVRNPRCISHLLRLHRGTVQWSRCYISESANSCLGRRIIAVYDKTKHRSSKLINILVLHFLTIVFIILNSYFLLFLTLFLRFLNLAWYLEDEFKLINFTIFYVSIKSENINNINNNNLLGSWNEKLKCTLNNRNLNIYVGGEINVFLYLLSSSYFDINFKYMCLSRENKK